MSAAPISGDARPVLRISKAASLLDTPASTLRLWVKQGRIRGAKKVGRCWVVPVSWVAEPILVAKAEPAVAA